LFAIAVDKNGYVPTHNGLYSKPLTGDYQTDLVGNRTKRIFSDTVGLAAGQNTTGILFQTYLRDTGELAWDISAPINVDSQHWGGFRVSLSLARVTEGKTAATQNALLASALLSFLVLTMVIYLIGRIIQPISALGHAAARIARGDYAQTVAVTSSDEIGTVSGAFNSMAAQLRELIGSLEQGVAARTKDLATVAEVGTATATILETNKLLQAVVDLTKERFNLYHSHIYLLDESGENLMLTSGAGQPGRQMVAEGRSIPLNREQSLVARAAREQKGVIVNDVTQAPDFLPNLLLPDTRSELAVPMIVGGKVIGVFDVQSDQVGRFTDSDINIQTTLAAQVAASIQNDRSFEQSKAQADLESLVNAIGQKIQRATSVDDTLQIAIREIGLALGATRVSANIGIRRQHDGDGASRN
jgi:putative methionine-R-sulfoxide reductase with GAF domain